MSWPNSLWVITLCLPKTLSALFTGTCRAFLSIRHGINSPLWEKHQEPGQLEAANVRLQLHRATCHLTGLKLTYSEFGLALLEVFGDLPLKWQAGPTLFSVGDVVRSQLVGMWLQDMHSPCQEG